MTYFVILAGLLLAFLLFMYYLDNIDPFDVFPDDDYWAD